MREIVARLRARGQVSGGCPERHDGAEQRAKERAPFEFELGFARRGKSARS
jgi:hypothetical protein